MNPATSKNIIKKISYYKKKVQDLRETYQAGVANEEGGEAFRSRIDSILLDIMDDLSWVIEMLFLSYADTYRDRLKSFETYLIELRGTIKLLLDRYLRF